MKKIILITLLISFSVEADYLKHPKSEALIDELVTNHGFEQSFVEDVLSNAVRQQKIIDSISKPAEFTWTWDRYKKLFIEDKRIANGRQFIKNNLQTLERAEKEFGVPKEVITAILGVETRYGKIQGSYRVIDSLLTLGFDYPRRAKFFRKELVDFFLLTRENDLNINEIKGSYAGAMGMDNLFLQVIEHMQLIMMGTIKFRWINRTCKHDKSNDSICGSRSNSKRSY